MPQQNRLGRPPLESTAKTNGRHNILFSSSILEPFSKCCDLAQWIAKVAASPFQWPSTAQMAEGPLRCFLVITKLQLLKKAVGIKGGSLPLLPNSWMRANAFTRRFVVLG